MPLYGEALSAVSIHENVEGEILPLGHALNHRVLTKNTKVISHGDDHVKVAIRSGSYSLTLTSRKGFLQNVKQE
jgi:hypothetical protein